MVPLILMRGRLLQRQRKVLVEFWSLRLSKRMVVKDKHSNPVRFWIWWNL